MRADLLVAFSALSPVLAAAGSLFSIDTDELLSNSCCDLTYAQINTVNERVRPKLAQLVTEDYFKHYKFNIDMNCPFFECQSICFSPGCQLDLDVHTQDYDLDLENDNKLGDLNEDSFLDLLCPTDNQNNVIKSEEWCEFNDKNGVIIDITRNPERFTGYIPTPEQNIWQMIYQHHLEGECPMEQQVFYQIISGFHSSVSTHLSNEYYNNVTNTWEPNLELFNFKVGDHPERVANIYFNYALISRAILKLEPYLPEITFNQHNSANNQQIKSEIKQILHELPHDLDVFNENLVFQDHGIRDDFKAKFKNVTKLMDCVTCDRCRLWGKIQSMGYATALKILFENPKSIKSLQKNEIMSLFNTFDRLTKSIQSIQNFNHLQALKDASADQEKEEQFKAPLLDDYEDDLLDIPEDQSEEPLEEYVPKDGKSVKTAFWEEIDAVWGAIKFIFQSYIDLPHNLKNYVLYHGYVMWAKFIGDRNFSAQKNEEYLHNIVAATLNH
ncbi:CYFA0S07e00540g1_1 [Cyberlindnera fabianii]|uniref:CYFA0S07e00540g1_1 n=1 Tax=Cyberlindnera fabianii TaxID=36022 RepID=A0A061B0Y2_CYBFA|nr:CYFA0S07e00540g1_1 [Cyberlindnera fabianii]